MTENERIRTTEMMISRRPHLFRQIHRPEIMDGIVALGMTPLEAATAAGGFAYQVDADPAVWPGGSDPYQVILAQSERPDNSEIWMTFKNARQFPGTEAVFRVHFQRGCAVDIVRL